MIPFLTRSFSQERYGISNSPYSGITGGLLNPAFMAGSPYHWDFNIVMAHSYFDNNYLFIYQTCIPDFIADNGNSSVVVNNSWNRFKGSRSKYLLKNKEHNIWRKNFYSGILIQGPSLMFNVKKWTFAIETDGREAASLTRLNKDGAKLIFEGLNYDPLHNIDITIPKFRVNAMVWDEIGISVAREIKKKGDIHIKAGLTFKHINAFAGAYFLGKVQLKIPNDSDIFFKNISAKYAYSINENNFFESQGKGKSMDAGITIEKKSSKNKYNCPNFCKDKLESQYSWKLGIALIDIGYARFKENAKTFLIENRSNYWFNFSKIKANDVDAFDSTMNVHFENGQIPIINGTRFTMFLPWAASIQYDYNVGYNFYLNGTWVQRIPHFGLPGVDRVNSIAFTPRYELNRFGIAMPIVMYNYLWPRIGFAIRIDNFLIIGTDKLGAFMGNRLSDLLYKNDINIEDISQKVMEGVFVMTMLVDMSGYRKPLTSLVSRLDKIGTTMGLKIQIQHENLFKTMHRV